MIHYNLQFGIVGQEVVMHCIHIFYNLQIYVMITANHIIILIQLIIFVEIVIMLVHRVHHHKVIHVLVVTSIIIEYL